MIDHALFVVSSFVAFIITSILPGCGDVKQVDVSTCSLDARVICAVGRVLPVNPICNIPLNAFSAAGFALYRFHSPISQFGLFAFQLLHRQFLPFFPSSSLQPYIKSMQTCPTYIMATGIS